MIRITTARLVAFSLVASIFSHYSYSNDLLQLQDVRCLAKNIYYESRGEPTEGKVAVGIVTLNRVKNDKWPDSICDVVYHRTVSRSGRTVCQFSWTCRNIKVPKDNDKDWINSYKISKNLLLGDYERWRIKYKKAHHFHNTSVDPKWNLEKIHRIGRHIFYH